MRDVTRDDCLKLQEKFEKYCETAEQHEFITLLVIQSKMEYTINNFEKMKQSELRSMFAVVAPIIGESVDNFLGGVEHGSGETV